MTVRKNDLPGTLLQGYWKTLTFLLSVTMMKIVIRVIESLFLKVPKVSIKTLSRCTDQTVVLTGGSRGIGLSILKILLQLDYTVILGARNIQDTENRINEIRSIGISSGKVKLLELDLTSLKSVRKFANQVLNSDEGRRIDVLLNNGICSMNYETTEDNFESVFQVCYLSHFLLTNLLLPCIKETSKGKHEPCQIINTTSAIHHGGRIDFNELEISKIFCPLKCYMDAKLCFVMHAKCLEKTFQEEGLNVHAYAVHPGEIPTDNWTKILEWHRLKTLYSFIVPFLNYIFRTSEDAAKAVLFTLLRPDVTNKRKGGYFENWKLTTPNPQALDLESCERLWNRSTELTCV